MDQVFEPKLYLLGAGFSKPAGLPLANELLNIILTNDIESSFQYDLERYLEFEYRVNRKKINKSKINIESFVDFLDIEHAFYLKGDDTKTPAGNISQIFIRNSIAKIIWNAQKNISKESTKLYEHFLKSLFPGDVILTFNYDTILETFLELYSIPYKYWFSNSEGIPSSGLFSQSDSIIILKFHGSINWFDGTRYDDAGNLKFQSLSMFEQPSLKMLSHKTLYGTEKLVEPNYWVDSNLHNIYKVKNVDLFLTDLPFNFSPYMILPSFSKIIYLNYLRELWYGFYWAGMYAKIAVIGFSFSNHDRYVLQAISTMIHDYHELNTNSKLKLIDYQPTTLKMCRFKHRLKYINWHKTDAYWKGFNIDSFKILQ